MTHSWNETDAQALVLLEYLPDMAERGSLGFALQLKFRQIHSRFPEHHEEIARSPRSGGPLKSVDRVPGRYGRLLKVSWADGRLGYRTVCR